MRAHADMLPNAHTNKCLLPRILKRFTEEVRTAVAAAGCTNAAHYYTRLHTNARKVRAIRVYVCVRICACAQRKSYIIIYICARSLSNAMKTADVDIARQCRQVKVVALQIEAVYSNNNNTTTIISYHI